MKTVIFDIDGTLIDSTSVDSELYLSSIREVIGAVRYRDLCDYEHVTDTGILLEILDDNGYDGSDHIIDAVRTAFVASLRRHIDRAGPFPIIDGAVQFVDRALQSDTCRIAIATGGWRQSAQLKLESAGFRFDAIPMVTSDDSPSRTEIMQLALKKAGGDTGSVTYFGDAEWDRRACEALGWNFVAVGRDLGGIESYTHIKL